MNRHENPDISITAPHIRSRGSLLRVLLPVFVVAYAALPIAVVRHSR